MDCATIAAFGKHQPPPGVKGLNCLFYVNTSPLYHLVLPQTFVLGSPILCNNFLRSLNQLLIHQSGLKTSPHQLLLTFLHSFSLATSKNTNKTRKSKSKMASQNNPTFSPQEHRSPWERPHLATEAPPPSYQKQDGYNEMPGDHAQPRYTPQGPVPQPQVVYVDRRQHRESDVAVGCCAGCAAGLCCCGCTVM